MSAHNVAINTRRFRAEQHLTLQQVSELTAQRKHALSIATLSKIETGKRGVHVEDLVVLAGVLGVSTSTLLALPDTVEDPYARRLIEEWHQLDKQRHRLNERMRAIEALMGGRP